MEGCRERWRQAGIDPTNKINYSSCFSWKGRAGSRDPHGGGNLPTFKFKAPLTQPALSRREPPPGGRPVWTHSPPVPSAPEPEHRQLPKGERVPAPYSAPTGAGGGGEGGGETVSQLLPRACGFYRFSVGRGILGVS